jgi:hypothetical protein
MCYGAHLNGFTAPGGLAHAWISRRSRDKSIDPDKLDNLVGGRIAAGMQRRRDAAQGGWEEAGLAARAAGDLNCLGAVRVEYSVPEGCTARSSSCTTMWLAAHYKPANQDGEVLRDPPRAGGRGRPEHPHRGVTARRRAR